jgi:hypothetical protein
VPDLPENLTFHAWRRSRLLERATRQGPRLGGKLALTLTDSNTGQAASEDATFTLMAPTDVAGLKTSAIKHMAPAPFARDAETTKLVHVDLWEPDLPWRYTPEVDTANLRPWLVLLVGTAEEIQVEGGLVTHVADSVLAAHDLSKSHLWAHTQWDGHTTIGRIVSPRGLETPGGLVPQHEYLAVLVPAFNDVGESMWTAPAVQHFGTKGILPAFHFWRFWTADPGDFETLAAALHVPPARDVGKALLHYRRKIPADGVDVDATLEVRGAITSLQQEETPQQAVIDAVRADLDLLNTEQDNTIGLPSYGRPWVPNPDEIAVGWPHEITDDPRFRGSTGLGVWAGVEAQESLMDAAVAQAGALREAGQRVGHLAFGLLAGGSLWDRRVPKDKNERLRLFGPMMSRMVAADGGIVLDRVASGSSPIVPALFSSAAQRLLRDRSSATRHISGADGGFAYASALDEANRPERQPERAPSGLPHVDAIGRAMGLSPVEELLGLDDRGLDEIITKLEGIVRRFAEEFRRKRDELIGAGERDKIPDLRRELGESLSGQLVNSLQDLLAEHHVPCEGAGVANQLAEELGLTFSALCMVVLADAGVQQQLLDGLRRAIRLCMARQRCPEVLGQLPDVGPSCEDLVDSMPSEPPPDQVPIDLGLLSDLLIAALDPRKPDAPAWMRLCSQLVGLDCTRLIPPEFPIGLDFPTWGLLRQYDKEWLLPGASALEKDSVTALQTNPTFIDAFMVGINTQFMSEMRWRDLAVERTCTPLRMFWGQVDYASHERKADIQPLAEWAKAPDDPLGALSHQSIQPGGSRLVITFRSDLFRRYPSTLVYLVKPAAGHDVDDLLKAPPELDMPDAAGADVEQWRNAREFFGPIFAGTLTAELTFFTFDVTPSDLDQYWLVLDEPPSELRFRSDQALQPLVTTNSATFAQTALDQPTRVAISGQELETQGLNP